MKNIYLILFLILPFLAFSQDYTQEASGQYDVGVLSISVIMPENVDGLTESELSKLEGKILQMVSSYGLSGNGYNANFVIYPKFGIMGEDEMPGMESMTLVEADLSLFVKQLDNNKMFASWSKSLKGMGTNRARAIRNAIGKIPVRSREVEAFMEQAKGRIIAYYEQRCDDIINEAYTYSQTKQYEAAIATLMTIPSEISDCFMRAQEAAIDYYRLYADQRCREMLQFARAAEANRDYTLALTYLANIDPETSCAGESLEMIRRLSSKVDQEFQRQWDFLIRRYEDRQLLLRKRLDAMVEIAKAYYRRTQPTYIVTYKSLF